MADPIQLTLVVRSPASSEAISERLLSGNYDPAVTKPSDLAADAADVKAVTDFATTHNLEIVKIDPAARAVRVAGSPTAIQSAFGINSSVEALNYKGSINLPPPLDQIVIAVLGLDHNPIARHHAG